MSQRREDAVRLMLAWFRVMRTLLIEGFVGNGAAMVVFGWRRQKLIVMEDNREDFELIAIEFG